MKKLNLAAICAVVLIFVVGVSAPVQADPDIAVSPSECDFGPVPLGSLSSITIFIYNEGGHNLFISDISFGLGSGSDFTITSMPSLPVTIPPPNGLPNQIDVEVTYSPTAYGPSSATLEISSNDPDEALVVVELEGVGVSGEPVTIEEILEFFNDSVEDGTLQGVGPDSSAQVAHINAMRHMLLLVAKLISDDLAEVACHQLEFVYNRCDGQSPPPDFVEGDDAPEFNTMILELMVNLGCI
jgi:hypothetical protein